LLCVIFGGARVGSCSLPIIALLVRLRCGTPELYGWQNRCSIAPAPVQDCERIVAIASKDCRPERNLEKLWGWSSDGIPVISGESGSTIYTSVPKRIAGCVVDGFRLVVGVEPLNLIAEIE